ncbi:MAG: polysaccharide deacetylase family protein [Pirellulaceae bacterium]|nr:polysaccharide deacetylase family protein [Planctomycetales bacterium]
MYINVARPNAWLRWGRAGVRRGVVEMMAAYGQWQGGLERVAGVPRLQILLLHDVRREEESGFSELLRHLQRHYEFVGYSEALRRVHDDRIDRPLMAFSFDDGIKSCARAAEIMERFGAVGCFFVCTSMLNHPSAAVRAEFCRQQLWTPTVEFLNWDQLESLRARGHEIGNHTSGHLRLSMLGEQQMIDEIGEAHWQLRSRLGHCDHFAWPYGQDRDFTPAAGRFVEQLGYRSCASGVRGAVTAVAAGQTVEGSGMIYLRRESVEAGWPLRHIDHFLVRSAWPTNARRAA